jgi:hypothetical protein
MPGKSPAKGKKTEVKKKKGYYKGKEVKAEKIA